MTNLKQSHGALKQSHDDIQRPTEKGKKKCCVLTDLTEQLCGAKGF